MILDDDVRRQIDEINRVLALKGERITKIETSLLGLSQRQADMGASITAMKNSFDENTRVTKVAADKVDQVYTIIENAQTAFRYAEVCGKWIGRVLKWCATVVIPISTGAVALWLFFRHGKPPT